MHKVSKIYLPQSFASLSEEVWSISPDAEEIIGTHLTTLGTAGSSSIYHAFIGRAIGTIHHVLLHVYPEAHQMLNPFLPAPLTHVYSAFDFPSNAAPMNRCTVGQACPSTSGRGINDNGDYVGFYRDDKGATHGYLYRQGNSAPQPFDIVNSVARPFLPGGTIPNACYGINNAGDIVGVYTDAQQGEMAYVSLANPPATFMPIDWSFPAKGALDPSTGAFVMADKSNARAINKDGDVIGTFWDKAGRRHGFVALKNAVPVSWDPAIKFDVDVVNWKVNGAVVYPETIGAGINDHRGVVGWYIDQDSKHHGYLGWLDDAGKLTGASTFDVPYASSTHVEGIANDGTVVGSYTMGGTRRYGFIAHTVLYHPETPHRLPNRWRLRPADSLSSNDVLTALMIDELISRLQDSELRDLLSGPVLDLVNRALRQRLEEPALR